MLSATTVCADAAAAVVADIALVARVVAMATIATMASAAMVLSDGRLICMITAIAYGVPAVTT